jgi:hypothetical protein
MSKIELKADETSVEKLSVNAGGILNSMTTTSVQVNFGSINANEIGTATVTFDGATLADLSFVIVSPDLTTVDNEIMFRGDVTADNRVFLRAHNTAQTSKNAPTATYDLGLIQFDA